MHAWMRRVSFFAILSLKAEKDDRWGLHILSKKKNFPYFFWGLFDRSSPASDKQQEAGLSVIEGKKYSLSLVNTVKN